MLQVGMSALAERLSSLGIRGKALGLAGLGLCVVPCVVLILIWRDIVLVSGLAPLLAIGSATLAAIATLFGLDLLLRPVSLAGQALGHLLAETTPGGRVSGQTGPHGHLMGDAQRVIDELIALRAEHQESDGFGQANERIGLAKILTANNHPAQAVVVLRMFNGACMAAEAQKGDMVTQMLAESTRRLQSHYGADLNLVVIGPTEMALVIPMQHVDLASTSDFSQSLEMLLSELGRPILSEDSYVAPLVLCGVAVRAQGEQPDQAIDQAITALGTATLGAPLVIFNDDVRDRAHDRSMLGQELRSAIRNEEFELYYQPVMNVGTNRPIGAEALIRWHSPARGFVSPDLFIPLAAQSGLIDHIGLWVLREACREAASWDPSMRVAINLGARQFMDEDLSWHVSDAIKSAGIRPDQLEIELTESIAMVDHSHTRATFGALRDLGVRIAIDDFGNGHADMRTLCSLPITTIKIDRAFVSHVHQDRGSQAICDALLVLGAGLDLGVVAAGTEKAEEVAYLARRGCVLFQGYYFARPVPAPVLSVTFDNLRLREAG